MEKKRGRIDYGYEDNGNDPIPLKLWICRMHHLVTYCVGVSLFCSHGSTDWAGIYRYGSGNHFSIYENRANALDLD